MRKEKLFLYDHLAQKTIANLKNNYMEASLVPSREEALNQVIALIPEGATIGLGDSVTLEEIGILGYLRKESKQGRYRLFDRYREGITSEEVEDDGFNKYRALTADIFLTGTNAVTLDGKLVNADGVGTRVAPLMFGPKKVIVVVGVNKIVRNVEEGLLRIKRVATPLNAIRHGSTDLPCVRCVRAGNCVDCNIPRRMGGLIVIVTKCRVQEKGRINVVIVMEELGF